MIKESTRQLDLLAERESSEDVQDRPQVRAERRLGFELDSREWLRLLAEEWWQPAPDARCPLLGIDGVPIEGGDNGRLKVVVWFDPAKLPDCAVPVCRQGKWIEASIKALSEADTEIVWPGVLPLFAVSGFSTESHSHRARLEAMAKGFGNLELGELKIESATTRRFTPAAGRPSIAPRYTPPPRWNSMRGAVAMATWAVPAIDPWLDLFCESLSVNQEGGGVAAGLGAPWLSVPLWSEGRDGGRRSALWAAICEVLVPLNFREEWRPLELLDEITVRAIAFGAQPDVTERYRNETRALLLDELVIDNRDAGGDPLWFALQLVMLRPKPEDFVAWIERLPAMSPATWWTGAMLSGFITGFKDLDKQYRGTSLAREMLAVRTWNIAAAGDRPEHAWPDGFSKLPSWHLVDDKIQFLEASSVWAERKTSRRGEWFRADLSNEQNNSRALQLALHMAPSAVRRCVRLKDQTLDTIGEGKLKADKAGKRVTVTGEVSLVLPDGVTVVDELDIDVFRDWLAVGVVTERLPLAPRTISATPSESKEKEQSAPTPRAEIPKNTSFDEDLPGLVLVPEFISTEEETELLTAVDCGSWLQDLRRRVQHYGWKYDYKARRIEASAYLGPLPEWAAMLASRLVRRGLINEMPDQVIVNEYVGTQGISKHIDCAECFDGPVVTVSLNETWGMIFRHESDGRKVERMLERRSAAVLSGEIRENWSHEIPKRKREGRLERGRRVSLTFRKVRQAGEASRTVARSRTR